MAFVTIGGQTAEARLSENAKENLAIADLSIDQHGRISNSEMISHFFELTQISEEMENTLGWQVFCGDTTNMLC